jgi:putative copper export protein
MLEAAMFLHIAAVVIWVGGMTFVQFCLRPALSDVSPQLRLPLLDSVFGRFFRLVAVAIVVILATGVFMLVTLGGAQANWPMHAMAAIGVLMMLLFGHIRFALYPRLQRRGPSAELARRRPRRRGPASIGGAQPRARCSSHCAGRDRAFLIVAATRFARGPARR